MTTPDTFSGEESSASFEPKKGASVEEIEADITRTRSDLGATVEQLAEKLDVKSRAKRRITGVKTDVLAHAEQVREHAADYAHRATDALTNDDGEPNRKTWVAVMLTAVTIGAVLFVLWRPRR